MPRWAEDAEKTYITCQLPYLLLMTKTGFANPSALCCAMRGTRWRPSLRVKSVWRGWRGVPFDLVLLDVWLKKMDGLETLERMQAQDGAPMVVMISGHGNIETAVRATKLGAFDFIEKPLSLEKVVLVVRNALEYLRLEDGKPAAARGTRRKAPDIWAAAFR